jgi:hypothetical protein
VLDIVFIALVPKTSPSLALTTEKEDRVTRRKTIRMCKVRWSHHSEEEATSEREDDLIAKYPELFAGQP